MTPLFFSGTRPALISASAPPLRSGSALATTTRLVVTATGSLGVNTSTPGTAFSLNNGSALIGGVLTAEDSIKSSIFISTSTALINIFPNASTTNLDVANLITVKGAGTSTFSGPFAGATGDQVIARGGTGNLLLNPYGGLSGFGSSTPYGLVSIDAIQGTTNAQTPLFVIGDEGTSSPSFVVLQKDGSTRVGIGTSTPGGINGNQFAFALNGSALFGATTTTD